MLNEVPNVRQNDGEPLRRIFNDEDFYLIIWIDNSNEELVSFQLFYTEDDKKMCVVWKEGHEASFRAVDEGESRPFRYKMAAVMKETGLRPSINVVECFKKSCRNMDYYIADKVVRNLEV